MYEAVSFFKDMDVPVLFGPHVQADDFNDDVLGRTLDKVFASNFNHLYSNLVVRAALVHGFSLVAGHGDTTSISVYGNYESASTESLNITFGHNKDGRPDCKQIMVGLVGTAEGIPIYGDIGDGNLSDVTWNQQIIDHLPEMFKSLNSPNAIYVADSKLVTTENLRRMSSKCIRFISLMPNTFGITERLKDWAFQNNKWDEIGALTLGKDAAIIKCNHAK